MTTYSDQEIRGKLRELSRPDTTRSGCVSLPNHLTRDPLKPDHAKENRAELWWIRNGDGAWRVA